MSRDRRGRSPQRCCAARRRRRHPPPRPPPLWHCRGSLPCGCGCQELRCVLRRLPVGRACGGAACGACLGPKVTRFVSWPMRATHTLTLCGACKRHHLVRGSAVKAGRRRAPSPSQRRGGGVGGGLSTSCEPVCRWTADEARGGGWAHPWHHPGRFHTLAPPTVYAAWHRGRVVGSASGQAAGTAWLRRHGR